MDASHVIFERPPLRGIQPVVRIPNDILVFGFQGEAALLKIRLTRFFR